MVLADYGVPSIGRFPMAEVVITGIAGQRLASTKIFRNVC